MPTSTTRARLLRRLRRAGIDAAPDIVDGLVAYYDLLRRWNEKINLTGLADGDEAVDRLLVEPLLAVRRLSENATTMLDVGSGGGSPAIPIRLAAPAMKLWMVESKVRKSAFLREVVRTLGLDGVVVETRRVEELVTRPDMAGAMDLVTMRAVRADLKVLAALEALLGPGSQLFLFTRVGSAAQLRLPPRLALQGEDTLIAAHQSCLVTLLKTSGPDGRGPVFHVEQ